MTDPIEAFERLVKSIGPNNPEEGEYYDGQAGDVLEVRAALTEKVDRDALYMMGYEAAKEEWKQIVHDLEDEVLPEGYVLVPRMPTEEMLAALRGLALPIGDMEEGYKAMIAAADDKAEAALTAINKALEGIK